MVNYFIFELQPNEWTGGGPRESHTEAIFVAHAFDVDYSMRFRVELEQVIKRTPSLSHIEVLDGKVAIGQNWSGEIRKRLKMSRLVIADLTILSPEVLFECGFAWGLSKPILPVTSDVALHEKMPRWLTDIQLGHFGSQEGLMDLLNSISEHLRDSPKKPRARSAGAEPRSLILLKPQSQEEHKSDAIRDAENQLSQTAATFGMIANYDETFVDTIESTSSELAQKVAQCSLLVAPLQNHPSDCFMHFACGVVASTPTAGASRSKLSRRVLLLVSNEKEAKALPADSARRVSNIIKIIKRETLAQELTQYGDLFIRWMKRQDV